MTKRIQMLNDLIRIRMVEESIAGHYGEQEMRCPVHLSIGQEAIAVGVCAALKKEDYVMSTHRAHAHYLAKGGDLKSMLSEIYGKANGCSSGMGGSMHLVDLSVNMLGSTPIVGGSIPVAVGTAFGSWLEGKSGVTVVFFGEGATEEGAFCESLNFASLKKLPIIFVCENNLYSVYSPLEVRQPEGRDRVALAKAHGMMADCADGNDVEAVYALTQKAADHARSGKGPVFLEFSTYRWREHCGHNYDNHIGYRTEEEFQVWRKLCPIETYQNRLLAEAVIQKTDIEQATEKFQKEIAAAFAHAKSSPFPTPECINAGVYAEEVEQ